MRSGAGGLEALRHLLFFGRRRICIVPDRAAYTISRSRLVRPEAP